MPCPSALRTFVPSLLLSAFATYLGPFGSGAHRPLKRPATPIPAYVRIHRLRHERRPGVYPSQTSTPGKHKGVAATRPGCSGFAIRSSPTGTAAPPYTSLTRERALPSFERDLRPRVAGEGSAAGSVPNGPSRFRDKRDKSVCLNRLMLPRRSRCQSGRDGLSRHKRPPPRWRGSPPFFP
jgi:hypothetical protein